MFRGIRRRALATGVLVASLVLALPPSAEARVFEPAHHEQVMVPEGRELAPWEKLWVALGSIWAKVSVLIDPDG